MVTLLVFVMATLEILWLKKTVRRERSIWR